MSAGPILVAGRSGQLARCLVESAAQREAPLVAIGRPELDVEDARSIEHAARMVKPSAIVNAAAYTAVDRAESEPGRAFAVNRDGAERLAVEAQRLGVPLVHISTEYVFDGRKSSPYTEEDAPAPLGVYGRSKLEGEAAVRNACPAALVLRTSWIYSPHGHNFVKTMLRLGETRDHVRVVDDRWGSPDRGRRFGKRDPRYPGPVGARRLLISSGRLSSGRSGRDDLVRLCLCHLCWLGWAWAAGDEARPDQKRGISDSGAPAGQFTARLRQDRTPIRHPASALAAIARCLPRPFASGCGAATMLKGIILAGGSGTRLYPITRGVSKQLLPIYDKPMVYYPLSTLMLAGIRDILVITTPEDRSQFARLLHDGSQWGIRLRYAEQPKPEGIGQALSIGANFIGSDRVALALGDNIFFGHGLPELLKLAAERTTGATVFAYQVRDPERYGVVSFNDAGKAIRIEEKPKDAGSNWAITGLYFFDNDVVRYAAELKPSWRGELEITDLHNCYLTAGALHIEKMGRGFAWLDTGTFDFLIDAASFVQTLEQRQGMKIACPEEIAYRMEFISRAHLFELAKSFNKSGYGDYLLNILGLSVAGSSERCAYRAAAGWRAE